jgi:Transposase family tnp2
MQDQRDSLSLGSDSRSTSDSDSHSTSDSDSRSTSDSEISEEDFDFLRTETWNNGSDMGDAEDSDSSSGTSDSSSGTSDSSSGTSDSSSGNDSETEQGPTPIVIHSTLPKSLESLRADLLGDYTVPLVPPTDTNPAPKIKDLSLSEKASLEHYVAWKKSNGTVKGYQYHATVLQSNLDTEILSLHKVKKLSQRLTGFYPKKVDMCPKSCIAYTGEYKDLDKCPYIPNQAKEPCGMARYKEGGKPGTKKPRAQVQILPVMATIRALYANADTSRLLRERDSRLKEALHLVGSATQMATRKFSDYGNSQVHVIQHQHMGLFKFIKDIALALSTDGAQLTMKKHSNTWLLILIILNLPPTFRYKTEHIIINLATPGPNSPGDIESFIRPLFEEMAMSSEGIWMWDAVDSSYFVNHAYIVMALGDMLGSAKLNGMAGHSAIYGDRFTMVQGARSSLAKGAKAQYYPMSPPENKKYNPNRPELYDLANLPIREAKLYWEIINKLEAATSKTARAVITKSTGVSRLPLCAASKAFLHPTYFPLDPFHLFYENNMAYIWDVWTVFSSETEMIHLPANKAREFGSLVAKAMVSLPPSFCGPIRDPYLKRQSQYKVYEWMALLHWYIIPIGIELGFNSLVLQNFSHFAEAVEFAMTISERTEKELEGLRSLIIKFLTDFEKLYVNGDPEKISRMRLCIFQLIHVPIHIKWNGSIRLGSQATVERSIGEMGHKIRSKKAPFANLANIVFERELVKTHTLSPCT